MNKVNLCFHCLLVLLADPTESHHHRMVNVGRGTTPILKQGYLKHIVQEQVQMVLRKLHNLSGQPVPVLCHPSNDEVLPDV